MAPTPQEYLPSDQKVLKSEHLYEPTLKENSIVISGISGLYPNASNIKEFADILYNKENAFTNKITRWKVKHPELPKYAGVAPGINHFDGQFFTVNYNLSQTMDAMSRKLLEHTFQALYDAGLSPPYLNGKNVIVYTGSSLSESDQRFYQNGLKSQGSCLIGCSKTMFANRISYWLNTKGASVAFVEADCSSATALEWAYLSMRQGECDIAIVGGAHLILSAQKIIHNNRIGLLSKNGTVKSFAEDAEGYVLSDAINVLILQKAKDALRVHAQLIHVKNAYVSSPDQNKDSNFGYNNNYQTTANFIKDFYKEAEVLPQAVEYVEGYGTAIPDADKNELKAIAEVYCKDRTTPLLVGSVTSNIGLTEAASGLAGITKVILGYHKGVIAANLNCERPRKDLKALRDGQMRIVTEHEPIRGTYAAINGFSVSGVRSHILLYGNYKPKNLSRYATSLPYLVTLSARMETGVQNIFEYLKTHTIDAEEIALLHNCHSKNISGHLGRGYILLGTLGSENNTMSLSEKCDYFNGVKRPLWFVYSGMGSQWAGMGAHLIQIPIFASAIERCHKILAPKGLDLVKIITSPDENMFDNILHSFVGIAAIQIGLTDILQALGLVPDGIIGHSVGELGCAYADNCLTAEEMILAAYSRGRVSLETPFIRGSMAAVGLGYAQISTMCPPEIDVACHNSSTSSTISGPADVMRDFVAQLTAKGVFAKEVPCSNIAYHSRYIAEAGPKLLQYLKDVITNPKARTERWLSTSVPQDKWNEPRAKYCSAEYHTNNLLNPVLFEETLRLIPRNAVVLEVAPHSLLRAILKRCLPIETSYIPLTKSRNRNSINFLLEALGNVYIKGFAINVQALYPKVEFPVSTPTPMLSHVVKWMHDEDWPFIRFNDVKKKNDAMCTFLKSICDKEYTYLQGHVIRNKMCYPFAAALVAVWDMFAMHTGLPKQKASVTFKDVYFYSQPLLFKQKALRLIVSLNRGVGQFEVRTDYSRVISGCVTWNTNSVHNCEEYRVETKDVTLDLTARDIYQLLCDRGYNYSGDFRSIEWANESLTKAAIVWNNNWVTVIDGMLQLNVLRHLHNAVSQLTYIREISIDVEKHFKEHVFQKNGKNVIHAEVFGVHELTRCGGVTLQNIRYQDFPMLCHKSQKLCMTPYTVSDTRSPSTCRVNLQQNIVSKLMTLECLETGNLDTLQWVENINTEECNEHLQTTVHFVGLNKLEVRKATGIIKNGNNTTYGIGYSGITKSGERVMGIVNSSAVSSQVNSQPELLWPVPDHWTLEDAATVPFAYAFAFYALVLKGDMLPGTNVFIHDGIDMIGQAFIAIALAFNCQVFTTVSDVSKKMLLRKLFPQLKEENIGNSQDIITFYDMVLIATQGDGCEIVISNVKGELKNASLKCCKVYGVVIDTVQIQDHEIFEYGMHHMITRSYKRMDFSSIFTEENYEDLKLLQVMISDGIHSGYVKPLLRVIYGINEVRQAFKLLELDQQCGKVLLRVCDNTMQVVHRIACNPDRCQIMFWDHEVLGVQLAEKLIHRGARNLHISSTSLTPYQLMKIRIWEKLGINVSVSTGGLIKDIIRPDLLKDVRHQGSVEGIYVVLTASESHKNISEIASAMDNLDSMSRLLCQQQKHFVIISTIKNLGEKLCLNRVRFGLVAKWLDLSNINMDITNYADMIDAIEIALCSPDVTFVAQTKPKASLSLFDQVIAMADITIPRHVSQELTLEQLGLPNVRIESICTLLKLEYNLSLEERDILKLTLNGVRKLEESVTELVPRSLKRIETMISTKYTNELLAVADIIVVPSLVHNVFSIENDFDITGQYLCIVPGIEGHHERFRSLCEHLKLPVVVLQPGLDHPYETMKETAQRYAKILSKKTELQNTFYILGYETGTIVAMELAAILENQGMIGTVFYLGCAPNELYLEVQEHLQDYETEEQLQDAILRHIYTIMSDQDSLELVKKLADTSSWKQKLELCNRYLVGCMDHSMQFVSALMEATFARLMEARRNTFVARSLRSKVVLLRAADNSDQIKDADIQQLSQKAISVHQLQLPISHAPADMKCSAIINQYLDNKLLEEFENKNLCESYVMQII